MQSPIIYTNRSIVMQRLQDAMRNGYTSHASGTTTIVKLKNTLAIFEHNYLAFTDKNTRARRKSCGLGNMVTVLWYVNGNVRWWLLSTPENQGKHPVHSAEKLKDALKPDERIKVGQFELVRLPKEGTDHSKLTWRITTEAFEDWQNSVADVVRSRSHDRMSRLLYELYSMPGFSGIRKQIGMLAKHYRAEIKRAALKNPPMPPSQLFYLRRIKHTGLSVTELLAQAWPHACINSIAVSQPKSAPNMAKASR